MAKTNPLQNEFWANEIEEMWNDLSEMLVVTLLDGMEGGVSVLPKNVKALVDWDWLNTSAIDFATAYKYDMIKGITDTTMTQVQSLLTEWIKSGSPLSVLEAQLIPIFGEARAAMIAATETTRVYAEGNMAAWESTEVVGARTWMTAEDDLVCDLCGPLDGEERAMDEEFEPGVDSPPRHSNCRCYLQPIVSEEALANKLDRILK